jgi:hypothetical protein
MASAKLGRTICELLNTEAPLGGVTAGRIRVELSSVGVTQRVGGGDFSSAI